MEAAPILLEIPEMEGDGAIVPYGTCGDIPLEHGPLDKKSLGQIPAADGKFDLLGCGGPRSLPCWCVTGVLREELLWKICELRTSFESVGELSQGHSAPNQEVSDGRHPELCFDTMGKDSLPAVMLEDAVGASFADLGATI